MPYGYDPITHHPEGWMRTGKTTRRVPRQTWGVDSKGHITGDIAAAYYTSLIDAGRHGDKAAIAELLRRDAIQFSEFN